MEALNAESISKAILGKLEQMGLDYKGCLVGMGFDGASVMSGKLGGVQKLIRDKSPMAYYLHCYAHRLNLVIIDITKVVRQADDFFSLLRNKMFQKTALYRPTIYCYINSIDSEARA